MKDRLRHFLNPLHLYCRLRDVGVTPRKAKAMCARYAKLYHLFL